MFDFDVFWHASLFESAGDERTVSGDGAPAFARQRSCSNYLALFFLILSRQFYGQVLLCLVDLRCLSPLIKSETSPPLSTPHIPLKTFSS